MRREGREWAERLADDVEYTPDVTFRLQTDVGEGGLIFEGVAGTSTGSSTPS